MKKLLLMMIVVSPLFLAGCGEKEPVEIEQATEEQLEKRGKMTEITEDTPSQAF